MSGEHHAKHVPGFALEPVRRAVYLVDAGHRSFLIGADNDTNPNVVTDRKQVIDDIESRAADQANRHLQ